MSASNVTADHVLRLLRANWAWLLVAGTLPLFATTTLFNAPLWLMALLGLWRASRDPRMLVRDGTVSLFGCLFLCAWLPMLLALPDAVQPPRALQTALPYVHFYFAGIFIIGALGDEGALKKMEWLVFAVVTLWLLDALLQFLSGANLFGYPYRPGQLSGMFHPKLRLGHALAVLTPLYLELIRRASPGRPWMWLFALLLAAVILLSGKRVAWIMAFAGCAAWGAVLLYRSPRLAWGRIAAGALAAGILLGVVATTHEPLSRRIEITLGVFSGDVEEFDRATARRLSVWNTALAMAREHWLNGVGPRGFRYAYREHAADGDFFVLRGDGAQTHPHQMLLEVAAETGTFGVLGIGVFWWLLLRRGTTAVRAGCPSLPWILCAGVAWLPLNAHLAFYGSYWSSVLWWLLACALAAAATRPTARA
ncbi:MAG TPA: O-antigen ligase family protein [Gammaproteobacteria bacterium]|jgi:O-antigen ligase